MATKKETAEQKLLKLIESSQWQKGVTSPSPPAQTVAFPESTVSPSPVNESEQIALRVAQSVRSPAVPGLKISSFLQNLGSLFKRSGTTAGVGLSQVNRLLTLVAVCMFFVLAGKMFMGWTESNQKISFLLDTKVSRTGEQLIPITKEVAYYLDQVQTRNIFKPYEKKQGDNKSSAENRVIASKTQHMKLRGISWLDSPETASAIVEDSDTGTTYFLKQGDRLKDVTVKTIYADQVIMVYEGEEIAIKL